MAYASHKVTSFPIKQPARSAHADGTNAARQGDPTTEILSLVEQLQCTSREAQERLQLVEEERDLLALQLDDLSREAANMESISRSADELRRDRDTLQGEVSKQAESIADMKRKLDDANRTRDEARKAFQEIARHSAEQQQAAQKEINSLRVQTASMNEMLSASKKEVAELQKQLANSSKSGADTQKQILALRQARDTASTQFAELKTKLATMEDRLAEMGDERDALAKKAAQGIAELTEQRELSAKLAADIAEKTREVADVLSERDHARGRAQELDADVERMKSELAAMGESIATFESKTAEKESEHATAIENLNRALENARMQTETKEPQTEASGNEHESLVLSLNQLRVSLDEAQRQIEGLTAERDSIREQAAGKVADAVGVSEALRLEISQLKKQRGDIPLEHNDYSMIVSRFEAQRLETIELSAQLENAHRVIKEMGASLAEARITAKNAMRRTGEAGRAGDEALAAKSAPTPPYTEEPRKTAVLSALIDSMKKTFQAFTRRPGDTTLLKDLSDQAQAFGEESQREGVEVLNRVASLLAVHLAELHATPAQVTPAMLRTVNQTIEFLQTLRNQGNLDRRAMLETARTYVVDDDRGVCEYLAAALASVGLSAKTTQLPGEAIAELAGNRFDLVVLDVHLPELNGFELCTHIRNMELHTGTPIIFITGDASMENRMHSSRCGGNEFLVKPINVQEFGLKALTMILRSRLRLD